MKFRTWLIDLEESGPQRNASGQGNTDRTTGLGPLSQYGRSYMMPVSANMNNRAVAGLIDGIGTARSKVRARKGAEPGVASQYHGWDDESRDGMTYMYMPLQTPNADFHRGGEISRTKSFVKSLKRTYFGSHENAKIWSVSRSDNITLVRPTEASTDIYLYPNKGAEDANKLNDAKEFTRALMEALIAKRLEPYAIHLNVENPQLVQQEFAYAPYKTGGGDKATHNYTVMMCAFVLKKRNNAEEIDSELRQELKRVLAGEKPEPTRAAQPSQPPQKPAMPAGGNKEVE